MLDVTFIYLPHYYLREPEAQLPLGILYLAAVCERAQLSVKVENQSSFATLWDAVNALPESKVFAITVTSLEVPIANDMAYLIRARFPAARIIVGGPGIVKGDISFTPDINTYVVGEAEGCIVSLVKFGSADRVVYGVPERMLDTLPFPARHLITSKKLGGDIFAFGATYDGSHQSTTIISSRGCPHECAFCCEPSAAAVRFRSVKNILIEVDELIERYNIRQFRFSDDSFTTNKRFVLELCEGLGTRNVAWRVSCRVKPMDLGMVSTMVRAGCKEFSLGVESFDDNVLTVLNKKTTAQDNANAIELINKAGGKSRVLFMIRTPGQTLRTVDINISWLSRLPYDIIACTTFVPLPGSAVWRNPAQYGIKIVDTNLTNYNFYFYSTRGENKIGHLIEYLDQDTKAIEEDSQRFRDWLKTSGKLNKG